MRVALTEGMAWRAVAAGVVSISNHFGTQQEKYMKHAGWWIPAVASLLLSSPQMVAAKASPEEAAKLGKG